MESRLKRYHQDNVRQKRSEKNKDLYNQIYEDVEYSNIEGVAQIEKTNEINIETIREMLNRNNKKDRDSSIEAEEKETLYETKEYDVKRIIEKAKNERSEIDSRKKSLSETNYNIFKNLNKKKPDKKEELKKIIDEVSNTRQIKQLNTQELSEKILSDVAGDTNKTITKPVSAPKLDKSFYTSGMKFKNEDFELAQKESKETSKSDKIIVAGLSIIIIVMVVLLFLIFRKFV